MKIVSRRKYRPDMTPYAGIIEEMTIELMRRTCDNYTNTNTLDLIVEQAYKRLFPDREIAFPKRRKPYIEIPF